MNVALHIARRYLLAKKSQNVINIISIISVCGVALSSLAMIVVLSGFNGLESLFSDMFSAFDPQLKVVPSTGKVFSIDHPGIVELKEYQNIEHWVETIEDQVLLRYDDRESPAFIKGVSDNYNAVTGLDRMMVDGVFRLYDDHGEPNAIVGYGLARTLGMGVKFVNKIMLYAPSRTKNVSLINPDRNFNMRAIYPSGFFVINQPEYDQQYLIVPISLAKELFEYENTYSAIELSLKSDVSLKRAQKEIEAILGDDFTVLNQRQQHTELFKILIIEKWIAYLILCFILLIASFNMIGMLSMLMVDKHKDIDTLRSIGANRSLIQNVFMFEGWMISLLGACLGLMLGIMLVWAQQSFGLINFGGGVGYIVDAYPVELRWRDVALIFTTVSLLDFLISWYTVRVVIRKYLPND